MRVSATGGAAVAVTTLAQRERGHRQPWFLSDGRRFLFYVAGEGDTAGIYLGSLDGSAPTRLTLAGSAGGPSSQGPWTRWSVSRRPLAAMGAGGGARSAVAGSYGSVARG
jgi:hypothetical protein